MKTIIGAAIGGCVHVGGLHHFLELAEAEGFSTISLGPAVPVRQLVKTVREKKPQIVAVSYRLTPETAITLFNELRNEISEAGIGNLRYIFGGTPPVAGLARESGLFEAVFDGTESVESIKGYLRGGKAEGAEDSYPDSLVERISRRYPYPLIRHHFGRPSLDETIEGAATIAGSGVLDVLSIGPDQNAQEYFFNPGDMNPELNGAGGVPLRKAEDLTAIYLASRCGNYPLVRCYSGTRNLIKWAEMSVRTIRNAWAAVPLCWYSVMDGRSGRSLEEAMREHQEVMRWYAGRNIPVEVNESHQWSLRDAHDSLAVAMAFIAAFNAKRMGVRHYVSQYMFNTPPATSPVMDIAKMLAKNELIDELADDTFTVFREVRAGLAHFSSVASFAQGQLAASAVISMALKPHILHVVGYSEGDHAIYPGELIHSCNIVHGVIHNILDGMPDLTGSDIVMKRKNELKSEAKILLDALKQSGRSYSDDPLADPVVISGAIKSGLLDAPHFQGNPNLCGKVITKIINGACFAVDGNSGVKVTEAERIRKTGVL
jgi:methylmalonyl-CoA mutase cobalamin-binding subunit